MSLREKIKQEIKAITPFDQTEKLQIADTLNWIDSGVELCRIKKPDIPNKHLVSYFVLVDDEYILLVDHINAQLWLPTGGHVEPNEHPKSTALREAKEELCIDGEFLNESPVFLTIATTVGKTAGHTDVSLWYTLKGSRGWQLSFDKSEFTSVKWFHKDRVPINRTDPHLGRFLEKLYA